MMKTEPTAPDTSILLEFMFRLGQAYLACGEQTAKVEQILRRTASAYGMSKSRVVAFPTAVFISIHDEAGERVTLAECEPRTLRLDQMADVYAVGEAAQNAGVAPGDGLQRLSAILAQKARFGAAGVIAGHAILTAGLAIVLRPTVANLAAAVVLGFIVGVVMLFNRGRALLSVPTPVIAAALVSTLVFLAVRYGLPVDPLHALVPPLVTFLPGGMLTLGMVELAYGDMLSGASRLIAGFVQLVLLAFGLAVGAALVGYAPDDLIYSAGLYMNVIEDALDRRPGVRLGSSSSLFGAAKLAAVDSSGAADRLCGAADCGRIFRQRDQRFLRHAGRRAALATRFNSASAVRRRP